MIIGNTPPFFTRSISSLASSMMVRSAAKSVSNTLSKPRRRSAQASREAAAALEQGGYALKDAAAALLDFYRTIAPSRENRLTKG